MAITTAMRTQVTELYTSLFGRAPESDGLGYWVTRLGNGESGASIANAMFGVAAARVIYPSFLTNEEIIGKFYTNVLGRTADTAGLAFWTAKLNASGATVGSVIVELIQAVNTYSGTDVDGLASKALFANKVDAGLYYAVTLGGNSSTNTVLSGVTATSTAATVHAAIDAVVNPPVVVAPPTPQTIPLTTGIDSGAAFTGGAGADIFNAIIGTGATLTALDSLDGGSGADTLNIADASGATALNTTITVKGIETVNVRSVGAVGATGAGNSFDTSANFTNVTNLNITNSTGADFITAGTGQAVTVSDTAGKVVLIGGTSQNVTTAGGYAVSKATGAITITDTAQAAVASTIDDGTSVSLATTATTVATSGTIGIGGTIKPTGAVTITDTLVNAKAAATNMAGGTVTVAGGTTISITQNATQGVMTTASTNSTLTQAAVNVTGSALTTSVAVNNTAAVAAADTVLAVAAVTETASVVFSDLTAGQTLIAGGLTFTATAAMTAAQTAVVFANLTSGATQGYSTLGTYTGALSGWTSAAASGTSVVFTSTALGDPVNLAFTGTGNSAPHTAAPAVTTTSGVAAVPGSGKGGITANTVAVTDVNNGDATKAGTITSVTASNYTTLGVNDNALTTLNLTGGSGDITIANAGLTTPTNKTLALALDGVTAGTLDDADIYTTLNITTANNASVLTNITDTALTGLTVSGTKGLNLTSTAGMTALKTVAVTGSGGLTATFGSTTTTSVDASASSAAMTVTVDGSKATYAGGTGVDKVTLSSTTVSKAVSLGDGDDTLTLAAGTSSLSAVIDGGNGTDTLSMAAVDAATATSSSVFATKVTGFEKLSLGNVAGNATASVDLSNMNNISYVVSANTTAGSGSNVTETASVPFADLTVGQKVTFGGLTVTAVGGTATQSDIETAIVGGVNSGNAILSGTLSGWTAGNGPTSNTDGIVLFTSSTANTDVTNLTVITGGVAAYAAVTGVVTAGGPGAENSNYTITAGMVAGQSLTIAGLTVTASAVLTANQVASAFVAANVVPGATLTGTATKPLGWTAIAVTSTTGHVVFTDTGGTTDVTNLTASTGNSAATAGADISATTVAGSAAVIAGSETITHMTNSGTLELSTAGAGVTVTMTDATSTTSDVLNLVVKAAAGINVGTIAAAGVETVNITSTDTTTTHVAGTNTNTIAISDSSAKSIVVSGNANLSLSSSNTTITSVDASSMTAGLTYTTVGTTAETVKGGALANSLTAHTGAVADTLIGGVGADTLTTNSGLTNLTGGAGADTFVIQSAGANVNVYSTIVDASTSDRIKFVDVGAAGGETFAKVKLALGDTAVFQDYANLAAVGTTGAAVGAISWFQFGGNTFVIEDCSNTAFFVDGTDIVVKLTGLVDLSAASFNSTSTTLQLG